MLRGVLAERDENEPVVMLWTYPQWVGVVLKNFWALQDQNDVRELVKEAVQGNASRKGTIRIEKNESNTERY